MTFILLIAFMKNNIGDKKYDKRRKRRKTHVAA